MGLNIPIHSSSSREDEMITWLALLGPHPRCPSLLFLSASLVEQTFVSTTLYSPDNPHDTIVVSRPLHSLSRREDVMMTRLRLGHTHLTHTHILSNSPSPVCSACGTDLTVNHILLTCPVLDTHRNSLSSLDSISKFFQDNSPHSILTFYVTAIFS